MKKEYQIYLLDQTSEPRRFSEVLWQRRNRLKRIFKRRRNYFMNWLSEIVGRTQRISRSRNGDAITKSLQPGDLVQVKSKEEIQSTLNRWNQLKGCAFVEEMWPY